MLPPKGTLSGEMIDAARIICTLDGIDEPRVQEQTREPSFARQTPVRIIPGDLNPLAYGDSQWMCKKLLRASEDWDMVMLWVSISIGWALAITDDRGSLKMTRSSLPELRITS